MMHGNCLAIQCFKINLLPMKADEQQESRRIGDVPRPVTTLS